MLRVPSYQGYCPCLLKCFGPVQTDRYAEYPKLKELVERKDGLIAARATAPTFLKVLFTEHLIAITLCEDSHSILMGLLAADRQGTYGSCCGMRPPATLLLSFMLTVLHQSLGEPL